MTGIERLGYAEIARYAIAHPELSDAEVGERLTRGLAKRQLAGFAASYVARYAESFRRSDARNAEEAAEEANRPDPQAIQRLEFERYAADPGCCISTVPLRRKFRRWMGEDAFAEWYAKGRALAGQTGGEKEAVFFESDWWEGGSKDYFAMRRTEQLYEVIREHGEYVRLKTTRELLTAAFALGDGTKVTWGDATVEQHQQRIGLLMQNISGTAETAIRHEAAINMIREAGVTRLADLDAEQAAA